MRLAARLGSIHFAAGLNYHRPYGVLLVGLGVFYRLKYRNLQGLARGRLRPLSWNLDCVLAKFVNFVLFKRDLWRRQMHDFGRDLQLKHVHHVLAVLFDVVAALGL